MGDANRRGTRAERIERARGKTTQIGTLIAARRDEPLPRYVLPRVEGKKILSRDGRTAYEFIGNALRRVLR